MMLRGGLVILVAALGVLLVRGLTGKDAPPTAARPNVLASGTTTWDDLQAKGGDAAAVRDGRAALRARFALWRGRTESLPPQLERKVAAALGAPAGTRFADPQRVRTAQGVVWAVNAGAATCVIQDVRGAVMCGSPGEVARRGLMLGVYTTDRDGAPIRFRALGLAPDGVPAVRLSVGGVVRRVAVRGNGYALAASRPILLADVDAGARS